MPPFLFFFFSLLPFFSPPFMRYLRRNLVSVKVVEKAKQTLEIVWKTFV